MVQAALAELPPVRRYAFETPVMIVGIPSNLTVTETLLSQLPGLNCSAARQPATLTTQAGISSCSRTHVN